MTVKQNKEGTRLTLFLQGRLETNTVPELKAVAGRELKGVEELILDLERLEYVSSAGLRVFLKMKKTIGPRGTMKVIHANQIVKEIFDITGFAKVLTIE